MSDKQSGSESTGDKGCSCPFCDAPTEKLYPFCKDCGKAFEHCRVCGKPIPPHRSICSECEE